MYLKEPHTVLFVALTGVGKTHLALDLLVKEYLNHSDFVIIICPTLRYNKMYQLRKWFGLIFMSHPIEPGDLLYDWIEKLGDLLVRHKTLF